MSPVPLVLPFVFLLWDNLRRLQLMQIYFSFTVHFFFKDRHNYTDMYTHLIEIWRGLGSTACQHPFAEKALYIHHGEDPTLPGWLESYQHACRWKMRYSKWGLNECSISPSATKLTIINYEKKTTKWNKLNKNYFPIISPGQHEVA